MKEETKEKEASKERQQEEEDATTLPPGYDPDLGHYQTRVATLRYPWKYVVEAYQRRFPTNSKYFPYIFRTEIVEEDVNERKTRKKITRKVTIDPGFPSWLKSATGIDGFMFIEKSDIDYENEVMKLETTNSSLNYYVNIYEKCEYRRHKTNPLWTEKEQTAHMKWNVFLFGMASRCEQFGSSIFISRAKDALEKEKEMIVEIMNEKQ